MVMATLDKQKWGWLKGGLTRVVNNAKHFVEAESMSEVIEVVKEFLAQLEVKYQVLVSSAEGCNADKFDKELDRIQDQYMKAPALIKKKLKEAEDVTTAPWVVQTTNSANAKPKKLDKTLKPFLLTSNHSPGDFWE